MPDPTTPVDVIARGLTGTFDLQRSDWVGNQYRVETTIGPVSADILATAVITALSEAGWEIVRADQPDAPEITAEMVDAAFAAWYERGIHEIEDLRLNVYEREHMRRALVAALKVRG